MPYSEGLHELADGLFAYLQPDGGWCLSNAGLVVDHGESLLIDTLADLPRTRRLLDAIGPHTGGSVGILLNTHSNLDHTFGNQLLAGARMVCSSRARDEILAGTKPETLKGMLAAAPGLGKLGAFIEHAFGAFDWEGIAVTAPEETFDGEIRLRVGDLELTAYELGPAHTGGDVVLHVPERRTVFTGDLVFNGGHPVIWAGPHENWIRACDRILELEPEVVVPGHGAPGTLAEVRFQRDYFERLGKEARRCFEEGLDPLAAAREVKLEGCEKLGERERLAANLASIFSELRGEPAPAVPEALSLMAEAFADRWSPSAAT